MLHLKKALCAALAITMILIGTSCDVLLAPEKSEEVIEKITSGNLPSESTPDEADSTGRNPTEPPPSESEKKEEPEDITSTEEITEEVTTVEELTEEVTTAHVHVETLLEAVAPTCTEAGLTEGKQCAECGEILAAQEVVPANGHTPGANATCTEPQNCTVCGETMNSAGGHIPGDPATCATAQTCTVCHTELTPAKGHTETISPAVAPTCTEAGLTEGKQCAECGEILAAQEVVPANGHTLGEWIIDKEPDWKDDGVKHATCTLCRETCTEIITPIDFVVTSENRHMVGYTGSDGEILIIPAVFRNEGVWYRVTGIGDYAFSTCVGLMSVEIPDGVTFIGHFSFYGCTGLASVGISDRVTSIGDNAFTGCRNLTSVSLPDSLISIGFRAFESSGLTSIHIPVGVTSLGEAPFFDCSALASITVAKRNSVYHSADNCMIATDSQTLILGCKNSIIPTDGSVTKLGEYAFCGCRDLTSIVIPDCITDLGSKTFYGCSGLTSIKIPDGVTAIGELTFYDCLSLISVDIPDSVTSIESQAFWNCPSLTSLNLPASVTVIDYAAFWNCSSLTSVYIPKGVTKIDVEVFSYCSGLTSVVIPNSVTSIEDIAFNRCFALTDVYFTGTEAEWNDITIGSYNSCLTDATIHFNYVP